MEPAIDSELLSTLAVLSLFLNSIAPIAPNANIKSSAKNPVCEAIPSIITFYFTLQ
jgi:hypothetical protein